MGDFNFILLAIVLIAIYFWFSKDSKDSKQFYPESEIQKTFEAVNELLMPNEDDHEYIIIIKEKNIADLKNIKEMYSRNPSTYTKEEITSFEKILPGVKQHFREACNELIKLKPSAIDIIEKNKNVIRQGEEALANAELNIDDSDSATLDIIEQSIETSTVKVKEFEDQLNKIEKSISRYKSL